jgi:hypothetical protein
MRVNKEDHCVDSLAYALAVRHTVSRLVLLLLGSHHHLFRLSRHPLRDYEMKNPFLNNYQELSLIFGECVFVW